MATACSVRLDLQQAAALARRDHGLPPMIVRVRPYRPSRGKGVQPAPAGEIGGSICRADEQSQSAQSQMMDVACRPTCASAHLGRSRGGLVGQRRRGHDPQRPARRGARRFARADGTRSRRHRGLAAAPARAAANVRPGGMLHELARATGKHHLLLCLQRSARQWRCRRRRTPGSHPPAISGQHRRLKRQAGRSRPDSPRGPPHLQIRERRSPRCRIWLRNSLVRSCRG